MVVGAKLVNAANQSLSMQTHPKSSWYWKDDGVIPFIGNAPQRESYAPSEELPPSHKKATQAPELHIGVAETVQSADTVHVVPTAAVASMVLHDTVTVKDITAGSPAVLPARDWICQKNAHTHATLRRQAQHIDGVWYVAKLGEEPRRRHTPGQHFHDTTVHLDGHVAEQIQLPLLTATLAINLNREEVIVSANSVVAAEPVIQHAYTQRTLGTGKN